MIKLVLSDMDFTLVCPGRMQVSERALAAIRALRERGVRFAVASGRDRRDLTEMFRGDASCLSTALMSNGKRIYLDGKLIHTVHLDRAALSRLIDVLAPIEGVYLMTRHDEGDMAFGISKEDFANTFWGRYGGIEQQDELPDFALSTAGIMFEFDDMSEVKRLVEEACPEFDFLSPAERMLDVLPHGWTKVEGIKLLQKRLGIATDEIVAFGDSDNDLAMMQYVGHSVAVSNANERVLAAARHRIGSTFDDAVAEALESLAQSESLEAPWE